jgi:hypothetical protein
MKKRATDPSLLGSDLAETYAAKIAEAWGAVLAGHARQVENHIAVAKLLVDAKATLDHGEWTPFIEEKLPFGIRKAEMYLEIGKVFGTNAHDLTVLPAHFTLLHALAKLDERVGEGTLARAAKLIHPDMTMRDVDDIVDTLAPPPPLSPAEQAAAAAPVMVPKAPPKKPKALIEAETKIQTLQKEIEREKEARRDMALDSIFVRSQVMCTLCGREHHLDDSLAQREVTAWIKNHIADCHPDDQEFVSVRYVIDRYLPPAKAPYTEAERQRDRRTWFGNKPPDGILGQIVNARPMLPPAPADV